VTTIRIATRGSDLALVQARYVAARIESELGASTEIVLVKTTGDRIQSVSLAKIGGKGLFVKEIEEALADGRADVAVHSAKDLPAVLADGLALAADILFITGGVAAVTATLLYALRTREVETYPQYEGVTAFFGTDGRGAFAGVGGSF